jgi:hypothetical protein
MSPPDGIETTAGPSPADVAERRAPGRRRLWALGGLLAIVVVVTVVLLAGGSGVAPPATGAAELVPADALAYVNVSLDRGRPSVDEALTVLKRFPDFPLGAAGIQSRLAGLLTGGRSTVFASQIQPWLGGEAALALLNTQTSTAGALLILDVRRSSRALAFVRSEGAVQEGSYRRHALYAYPTGTQVAFVSHFLLLGAAGSVRAALDVAAGAAPALAGSSAYGRATAGEPAGRVLDAYASLQGVRRVLAARPGLVGAIGGLLYQPALQGVSLTVSPGPEAIHIRIHSARDRSLIRPAELSPTFSPTLQRVIPSGGAILFDVRGLDRLAPRILDAGATAGVGSGLGPLLAHLGVALRAEGVNVHQVTSIFSAETALAILPAAQTPALVVVARAANQRQVRTELAELEIPLAQLFTTSSASSGRVSEFNDVAIDGVTAHQLALANGLQLDYAVFDHLLVFSTSASGISAIAARTRSLAGDTGFRSVFSSPPNGVTALGYVNLPGLLPLAEQTGLLGASYSRLRPDLAVISTIGLASRRGPDGSTAGLSLRIR